MSSRESFEFAGRNGHYIMGIPMGGGTMAELVGVYREEWKKSGHPGNGKIMLSFSMFADEDGATARDTYRPLLNAYLERLVDAASGWLNGASTKTIKGYDKMIAALKEDSFDGQLERGICWTGSPGEIADMITDYDRQLGGFDIASLHLMPHVMDVGVAEKSMRLFAEKVMPNFRGGLRCSRRINWGIISGKCGRARLPRRRRVFRSLKTGLSNYRPRAGPGHSSSRCGTLGSGFFPAPDIKSRHAPAR